MSDIVVDTYKLRAYADRISSVNSRLYSLDKRLDKLYLRVGLQGLFNLVQADALTCYSYRLRSCRSYLISTAYDFETAERLILNEDPLNFRGFNPGKIISVFLDYISSDDARKLADETRDKFLEAVKPYGTAQIMNLVLPGSGLLYLTSGIAYGKTPSILDYSRTPDASAEAEWLGYEYADGHPGVTGWVGNASASAQNEVGYAGVNAYLGKGEANFKGDFSFMEKTKKKSKKDGKWVETEGTSYINAEIGASASVNVAAADANAGLGSDMLGVDIGASGSVGNGELSGKAQFSVSDEGVDAKLEGKAMVSAAKGEAKGTINILGIEITGKIGGYAGAAGVEGKVGIEDNKFVCEGGVAAVLGVSGGVEIGFNDEGWNNFTQGIRDGWDVISEGVTEGWNDFTDRLGDDWDYITESVSDGWNYVTESVSDGWNYVTDSVSDGWNYVTDSVSDGWNNFVDFVSFWD